MQLFPVCKIVNEGLSMTKLILHSSIFVHFKAQVAFVNANCNAHWFFLQLMQVLSSSSTLETTLETQQPFKCK